MKKHQASKWHLSLMVGFPILSVFFIQSLAFPTQFQKVESVHPNQSGQNSDSSRASDSNVNLKENMAEVLRENPEIIINALKGHERKILDMVENALREQEEESIREQRLAELQNPFKPEVGLERPMRGRIDAPITIVEYSDFQCPFCRQTYGTVKELVDKYPGQVRLVYKHLLLPSHELALLAAQFFEAIALQSHEEAWVFHDQVFEHQDRLTQEGKDALWDIAKGLSVDQKQLGEDLDSFKVHFYIKQDEQEANKFGFTGTPIFLINGVSIRGAHPKQEFVNLIEMILAKNR